MSGGGAPPKQQQAAAATSNQQQQPAAAAAADMLPFVRPRLLKYTHAQIIDSSLEYDAHSSQRQTLLKVVSTLESHSSIGKVQKEKTLKVFLKQHLSGVCAHQFPDPP